ncbi:hypothetical protein [Lysobacter sp. Root690]|uniref:hypothetical protein n=1 Tax=Lysobacter sp. Root690 TaxID=1736588 RepID=UPI0006F8DF38|nr:hypothetical protein [Lysobacter sp. Root690]KRB08120.1 hypothetical protein ASD86_10055 [Lysobacter sp. Root690]
MSIEIPARPVAGTTTIGWWRRNTGWLIGTAVLGGIAIYAPYRDALNEYRDRNPSIAIDAPKHDWVQFEGARWRLVEAEALAPRDPRILGSLRKDAGVLLVRYEVIPDSGTPIKTLDTCRGRVADAQGRQWEAGPVGLPRLGGPKLPTSCGSGYDAQFKSVLAVPGRPFAFQHAYVLPRTQKLEGLEARIEFGPLQSAKGRYLRFKL